MLMVDLEDEEALSLTFNHFDDELDTAGDMDALNNYDLEELGEIEHECKADTYELDNAALNNLDDSALSVLLEAEQGSWAEDGGPYSQSVSHTSGSSLGVIADDIKDDFGNNESNGSLDGMMDKHLDLEEALRLHKYRACFLPAYFAGD
ncbi:hypothetical protein F5148DRAFT_1287682 [Russula earlei]|uniref:Uncharacterized protein n=1 Tax=Russula earlei TaxID=71964 RepID=A0ACC0U3H9_9AGAM|nr:hypothetical protein F5148DRAFT_1287682 [Russula earlei]